jgi:hypothetical protein
LVEEGQMGCDELRGFIESTTQQFQALSGLVAELRAKVESLEEAILRRGEARLQLTSDRREVQGNLFRWGVEPNVEAITDALIYQRELIAARRCSWGAAVKGLL